MSLDTVLKIGKAFRASENSVSHFRYVKPYPKDNENENITCLSLPINEDFSFDFSKLSVINNQNIIGTQTKNGELYYLRFKTSDSDGSPTKYLFGDIYYSVKESKEALFKTGVDPKLCTKIKLAIKQL
jgi:hypothetical protein